MSLARVVGPGRKVVVEMEMIVGEKVTRLRWDDWEGTVVPCVAGGWTWRLRQNPGMGLHWARRTFAERGECEGSLMDFALEMVEAKSELVITQGTERTEQLTLFS